MVIAVLLRLYVFRHVKSYLIGQSSELNFENWSLTFNACEVVFGELLSEFVLLRPCNIEILSIEELGCAIRWISKILRTDEHCDVGTVLEVEGSIVNWQLIAHLSFVNVLSWHDLSKLLALKVSLDHSVSLRSIIWTEANVILREYSCKRPLCIVD